MKTKLFFGIAFCLFFSACIKDYLGHGDDENDKGLLTESNYLYTDDIKTAFLEESAEELNAEIKDLQLVLLH